MRIYGAAPVVALAKALYVRQYVSPALVEQAVWSASNYLTVLLLARFLDAHEFGLFALGNSALLVMLQLHSALLAEPAFVCVSATKHRPERGYLSWVYKQHITFLGLLVLAGLILLSFISLTGHGEFVFPSIGLLLAAPPYLTYWQNRRIALAALRDRCAGWSSLLVGVVQVVLIAGLHSMSKLTVFNAFLTLAAGSGLGSALLWPARAVPWEVGPDDGNTRDRHREYARRALAAAIASAVHSTTGVWVTGGLLGVQAAGIFAALMSLLRPLFQFNTACSTILLRRLAAKGRLDLRTLAKESRFPLVISGAYSSMLALFPAPILVWIYGGAYAPWAEALRLAASFGITSAVFTLSSVALRSMGRPDHLVISYTAGTALAAGVFITVPGASLSLERAILVLVSTDILLTALAAYKAISGSARRAQKERTDV